MIDRFLTLVALLALSCGPPAVDPVSDAGVDVNEADTGRSPDAARDAGPTCSDELRLAPTDTQTLTGTGRCEYGLILAGDAVTEVTASDSAVLSLDEASSDEEPGWIAPILLDSGAHTLVVAGDGEWSVTVETYGGPVETVDRDRSLVWTDPELLDDPDVVGLGRLMTAAANGDDGGELFADWLRRFATTRHSERVGPLQFLEEIEETHGDDPARWDLDALEFKVTGIHNRVDLATDESCGELRVSIASTHPLYQPFHAIFLFEQVPTDGDVSPAGSVHCGRTLRRWARLSRLDDDEFRAAARQILDDGLRPEKFIMAETVEFIISPWEWRQWRPTPNDGPNSTLDRVFQNPPLFQTIDTARLNEPGPRRDEFLQFVEENAGELDARTIRLPERFRPQSARVNAGVPWVPLDLDGVDPTVTEQFPELRQNIEMMGCPACHATDADFIQTRPDRTFSPFYDKELDARADYLRTAHRGDVPAVPFGPLQNAPVLPP